MPATLQTARKPQARSIIAFSSLIMVIFCVVVAYQASKAYQTSLKQGEEESALLIQSVSTHVELALTTVDSTLRRAIERDYMNSLFGRTLKDDLEHNFRTWVKETPQIAALYMTDAGGRIVIAARTDEADGTFMPGEYASGYHFYQQAERGNDTDVFVNLYTPEKAGEGKSYIAISRHFERMNGDFGGVVFALVRPEYFTSFFRSIGAGPGSFMTLLHANGQVLVSGATQETEEIAVTDPILAAAAKTTATQQVNHEGRIKIFSFNRLTSLPVTVAVVTDEVDFLAGWRSDRRKDVGFLAMFAIFGSILSYFALTMVKQIKRVEESESAAVLASQAKSDFLANMSHELRTPLNAIIGFSEMLDAGYFGKLTPKQKERIHDINLCGNHLLQLINDILEFSKCEAGKVELVEEEMDIGHLMHECARMMAPRVRNKNVEIAVELGDPLATLHGDKRKVRQLLLNLLSNATKFTEEGGRITLSATSSPERGMVMSVEDTGIGMNEADIPVALSVFGQVHRASHPEGTGLGLPLCRMFAELHGGVLELKSKAGIGTTVTVTFPATRLRAPAKEKAPAAVPVTA